LLFSLTAVPIDECFCSSNWMSLNREVHCRWLCTTKGEFIKCFHGWVYS
jgi:hypothetical protein